MALFVWRCERCKSLTRKILPKRPVLGRCFVDRTKIDPPLPQETVGPCGGELKFVSNTSSQTMEVIDNGLMAKVLERPVNIEEKMSERNAQADTEQSDEQIV